jgi:magnesium and cobalt transporter
MDDGSAKKPNFFERVLSRLSNDTPENADEILEVLRAAADNEAVDSDTLQLLENVLDFSDMEVRDVMVTRSQMDVIKASDSIERIIAYIQETAHSRFPVIGEDKDEILGFACQRFVALFWSA